MGIRRRIALRMAKRYVSGESIEDAITSAKSTNSRGMGVRLNFLGEHVTDDETAERNAQEYLRLQKAISLSKVHGCVSVKLTQLGFQIDESKAEERLERLVKEVRPPNRMVWIDMESSGYLERTLKTYSRLYKMHENLGITLQAYLRRSRNDLRELIRLGAKLRLVKGAYSEPPESLFRSKEEVRQNFVHMMNLLFEKRLHFTIATQDPLLIQKARSHSTSRAANFEFEKLMGIGEKTSADLVSSGYRVSEYVPYGSQWYNYYLRRMKSYPGNLWPIFRHIV